MTWCPRLTTAGRRRWWVSPGSSREMPEKDGRRSGTWWDDRDDSKTPLCLIRRLGFGHGSQIGLAWRLGHAGFLGDRNKFGVGDEAIKCNMEVLPLFSPLDEADIDLRVYRNVLYFVGTRLGCCQKPHLGVPCYLQTHPLIQISPKSSS